MSVQSVKSSKANLAGRSSDGSAVTNVMRRREVAKIGLRRRLKELFNRKLKCERVGHETKTSRRRIMMEGGGYRAVATVYKADIHQCRRCWEYIGDPTNLKEIDSYTSVSMSSDSWDTMRERGWIFD